MVLIDGHDRSRFTLPIVQYVNYINTKILCMAHHTSKLEIKWNRMDALKWQLTKSKRDCYNFVREIQ